MWVAVKEKANPGVSQCLMSNSLNMFKNRNDLAVTLLSFRFRFRFQLYLRTHASL